MSDSKQGGEQANGARKPSILAVDDEPAVLSLVERLLQSWGYPTAVARSESECLEVWRERKDEISTAIVDLRLGTSDGRKVAALLQGEKADIKIIFMSGYPIEEFNDKNLVAGKNFIAKPFGVRDLRKLL